MAACGSLQHLFDKTLPENPTLLDPFSPWKAIKNMKPVHNASFTEIFGELHHHQMQLSPSTSPEIDRTKDGFERQESEETDASPASGNRHSSRREHYENSGSFSENPSTCTEGLGFESSDDVEDLGNDSEKKVRMSRQSSKRSRTHKGIFPPPISCIGRTGKPWVCFRSYREDGRFILQEIRFPTQEFLHACREDGRLRLQYIQSDEEILGDDEDEHQEEEEEEDDDDSIGDDQDDIGTSENNSNVQE